MVLVHHGINITKILVISIHGIKLTLRRASTFCSSVGIYYHDYHSDCDQYHY